MAVKSFNVMNLGKGFFDPKELGYRDSLDVIKDESVKIQKSFVKIGWYLKHIRDEEMYIEDGYANIYECAADQLGYSQSTVSRFINICERFSKNNDSPELDEKYAGFDKSQMIEMLPLEEEELKQVTPEMTVKEIREIKESKKKKAGKANVLSDTEETDMPGQTSLEEDFPEYMPDECDEADPEPLALQEESYATSHKESEEDDSGEGEEMVENLVDSGTAKEMIRFPWKVVQPEMPQLKNNEQRKEWLGTYKEWGLWYRDENIDVNYYKFDFEDGSRLIVAEYPQRHSYYGSGIRDEKFYHLMKKNRKGHGEVYDDKYRHETNCETELVEFLKTMQKGKK